jgi:hypothetical protein
LRLGNSIDRFAAAVMAFKLGKTPTVKFNNGIEFPIFGLGTWKVSQLFSALTGLFGFVADRRKSRKFNPFQSNYLPRAYSPVLIYFGRERGW